VAKNRRALEVRKSELLKAVVVVRDGIVHWQDPSGLVYISQGMGGDTFKIDGVAALVWQNIAGTRVGTIVDDLARELGIDRDQLEADVELFINRVIELGLVNASYE
jgi:Coenzyme PQQ synthesis protein D (PqqD)